MKCITETKRFHSTMSTRHARETYKEDFSLRQGFSRHYSELTRNLFISFSDDDDDDDDDDKFAINKNK